MRRIIFPTQDASIYEEFSWRNTGHDEILEVGKSASKTKSIRSLIQFNISDISSSLSSGEFSLDSSFELKLFIARADDIQLNQVIYLAPLSQSWVEGTGYYYQNTNVPFTASRSTTTGFTETDGVTWESRQSASFWFASGSDFITGAEISSSLADPVIPMTFDITPFILNWVSGTMPNYGMIIKFPDADEQNNTYAGDVRYFSRQTHTIYSPLLIAKWNDQIYLTGSMSASNTAQMLVTPRTLEPKYKLNELVRVDLSVRDRWPLKTFDTVFSAYVGNQRLPQTSYFSIVDIQSNTVIIPFDNSSLVQCDGTGSYFDFHVEGMYAGRFYKVMIKSVDVNYTRIFDLGHHFTIEQA